MGLLETLPLFSAEAYNISAFIRVTQLLLDILPTKIVQEQKARTFL